MDDVVCLPYDPAEHAPPRGVIRCGSRKATRKTDGLERVRALQWSWKIWEAYGLQHPLYSRGKDKPVHDSVPDAEPETDDDE